MSTFLDLSVWMFCGVCCAISSGRGFSPRLGPCRTVPAMGVDQVTSTDRNHKRNAFSRIVFSACSYEVMSSF